VIPALIVVVPVRLVWELLSAVARFVRAYVLRPVGWLLFTLLVRPLRWTLRVFVLLPLRWVAERLLVPVGRLIARYVLRPVGIALAWALSIALIPVVFAGRWIGRGLAALWRALWPLLTAVGRLLAWTWHLAGVVLFHLLVRPVRYLWRLLVRPVLGALAWAWRVSVRPAARWLRGHVWEPARAAGRSVTRALGLDARRP
jgi:hypothetical protein